MPEGLSLTEIGATLASVPHAAGVRDLHVWSLCSGHVTLSAHVVVSDQFLRDAGPTMNEQRRLQTDFGIEHTTIQFECAGCGQGQAVCVTPAAMDVTRQPDVRHCWRGGSKSILYSVG